MSRTLFSLRWLRAAFASVVRHSRMATHRRWLQFAFPGFLVLLTIGCVRSEKALVDEKASIIDADLIGEWHFEGDDGTSLSIRKKPGVETVLEAVSDDERVDLLLSKIGDHRYLCVKFFQESPTHLILRYELQGNDQAGIYQLDEAAIYDAVINKELAGTTWRLFGKWAKLSGSSAEIRAYLELNGEDVFERDASVVLNRSRKPH